MRFHRPKTETPRPYLVPESHNGRHGFAIYLDGKRLGWGASESAAWAVFQMVAS